MINELTENGILVMEDFAYSADNDRFESLNKDNNSKSAFTLIADEEMTIGFTVVASSELYDYIVVYVNGVNRGRVSGKNSKDFYESLEAGDVLTISYEKDSSTARNDDCGYITDLVLILKQD